MLLKYIRSVISHATNTYSIVSLFLAMVPFFVEGIDVEITPYFVLASLTIASFYAWKDLEKKMINGFNLSIRNTHFSAGGFIGTGALLKESRVFVDIDFLNNSDVPNVIERINEVRLKEGYSLFDPSSLKPEIQDLEGSSSLVWLPIKVDAKNRKQLRLKFPLKVIESDPEKLPEIIANMKNLELFLSFECLDQNANTFTCDLNVSISSDNFVESLVLFWKKTKLNILCELYKAHKKLS